MLRHLLCGSSLCQRRRGCKQHPGDNLGIHAHTPHRKHAKADSSDAGLRSPGRPPCPAPPAPDGPAADTQDPLPRVVNSCAHRVYSCPH
eukprot:1184482-Prorocentrum_minimum.AAC.1